MFYSRNKRDTFQLANKEYPRVSWWREPGLRRLYALLLIPLMTSMVNGYDGSMTLGHRFWPSTTLPFGLGNCIAIIPYPIPALIADKLGRKWNVIIGSIITIIGVALQGASQNVAMFVASRFIIGYGVQIEHGGAPLMVTELAHTQHRAIITSIYNSTWYVGAIVAAWTTFGTINIPSTWAWRIPSILQGFPAVLQIFTIWFVPESPRWLIYHNRPEEAYEILKKYHGNGEDTEFVRASYLEIRETIELERSIGSASWSQLFSTPGNRHRTLLCFLQGMFSQFSGTGLCSYYLVPVLEGIGITNNTKQAGINGGLQIWNTITALWAAFNIDRFGRRPLMLCAQAWMVLCFVIWTILSARFAQTGKSGYGNGTIAMIFLFFAGANTAWQGMVIAYPLEICTYELRAKGLMVTFIGVQFNLLNQYVNPIGVENLGWKYYIFYCVWLSFVWVVIYFLWVETKFLPLEEIAKVFDGENATLGGRAATARAQAELVELGAREKQFSVDVQREDLKAS